MFLLERVDRTEARGREGGREGGREEVRTKNQRRIQKYKANEKEGSLDVGREGGREGGRGGWFYASVVSLNQMGWDFFILLSFKFLSLASVFIRFSSSSLPPSLHSYKNPFSPATLPPSLPPSTPTTRTRKEKMRTTSPSLFPPPPAPLPPSLPPSHLPPPVGPRLLGCVDIDEGSRGPGGRC